MIRNLDTSSGTHERQAAADLGEPGDPAAKLVGAGGGTWVSGQGGLLAHVGFGFQWHPYRSHSYHQVAPHGDLTPNVPSLRAWPFVCPGLRPSVHPRILPSPAGAPASVSWRPDCLAL